MSTLKTNNVQVGQSVTATNNFTLYQPATPDGTVRLGVGNTGATTLDVITANSAGNVGIGTTITSNGRLNVFAGTAATGNSAFLTNIDGTYNPYLQIQHSLNGVKLFASSSWGGSASALTLSTPGGDVRLDGSGNLLVGTTSNTESARLFVSYPYATSGGSAPIGTQTDTTLGVRAIAFRNPNGLVGTISTSGSATFYNTSSDYRLKEQVQPMTGALARVSALKPVTYKWKVDGSDGEGFIAHELQAVVPDCVTGEKDAVDAEGNPVYQGIDTSFLVATLTAAIQELKAEVDALKAQLAG